MASLAVCGPHTRRPTKSYLDSIRSHLISDSRLSELMQAICTLGESWDLVSGHRSAISALPQGLRYTNAFKTWIQSGKSDTLIESKSGIIQLSLLVIIQITQYVQYLDIFGLSHAELLKTLRENGGVQGYCAGLLPAYAIAISKDESDLGRNAAVALRIALAIGAYQELGDEETVSGAGTMVLRLSAPGEGDGIIARFPGLYISAVTDPRTLSIVGPMQSLDKLAEYAQSRGLKAQDMDLRGKVHNPENMDYAAELCKICDKTQSLQFPEVDNIESLALYSNRTGKRLENCSLTHEAVYTILTAKCEWYTVLQAAAEDLKNTGVRNHTIACFGLGDILALSAFHQIDLSVTKIDVCKLTRESEIRRYQYPDDAVAVVGASCRLPGANNLDELWELIAKATSMCEPIRPDRAPVDKTSRYPRDTASAFSQKMFGNFVDDVDQFDYGFFRNGFKEAAYMDPQSRILLEVAYEALDSSGYLRKHDRASYDNVGCFIGSSSCEYLENTSSHAPTAFTSTGTLRTFLSGRLSYYFGWKGPAEVIDTACSSSLVAINRACKAILGGECPMAIAGGVNLITGVTNYLDLDRAGFLSPTGQCKPFDVSADGYCRSDGAGIVVLKRLRDAERAGDHILGVITGIATNQGGLSKSITVPDGPAQVELFQSVLDKSGMTADHVTYVEAHGTGTQVGDPIEVESIRNVFGGASRLSPVQIGTIKGNVGHCEGAAGVAGLLKVLCMFRAGKTPPLANFKKLNPKIPPLAKDKLNISQTAEPWLALIRVACVNNYGASGSNAAAVISEYRPTSVPSDRSLDGEPVPIIVSAHSRASLSKYLGQLDAMMTSQTPNLSDLAFTLSEKRARHPVRWMTVASDISTLRKDVADPSKIFEAPLRPKSVVLAFGGQAKQTVALERSLYDTCPRLKHYIDVCDELLTGFGFPSILPTIFDSRPISDVVILQTAMFASQYACAQCWIDAGVEVKAVVGHSLGELAALVISGTWPLRDGIRAVATRAQLMSKWGPERGAMLVVHATADAVHELIQQAGDCEIACYNASSTQVVVGSASSVAKVEAMILTEPRYQGYRCQRVDVTHGFHSKLTEPLLEDLAALGKTIPILEPEIPIEICTREQQRGLPSRLHIARHMRDPVYFEAAVRRIEDRLGPCVWLEAGTDTSVVPMLKRAVQDKSVHAFQSLTFKGTADIKAVLPNTIVNLALENINATHWPFLTPKDFGLNIVTLPTYPFNRSSAWVENIDRATELALKSTGQVPDKVPEVPKPPQLVNGPISVTAGRKEFAINTDCTRYIEVLSAHKVLNSPLCPSSLYMECAVMALQLSGTALSKNLCFEQWSFESPLGTDPDRNVTLTLLETSETDRWKVSVQSTSRSSSATRSTSTTHASGCLALGTPPSLGAYQRMITPMISQVQFDSDSEKLMAQRAYTLFGQVVTYGQGLRGIRNIYLRDCQAVAEVQIPAQKISVDGTTASERCDAVLLDIVVQVAGLLVNSSDQSEPDSVLVAGGLDAVTLPSTPLFTNGSVLKVFAQFSVVDKAHMSGDVFVMEPDGKSLAFAMLGVAFTRIPRTRLKKLLDAANAATTPMNSTRPPPKASLPEPVVSEQSVVPAAVSTPSIGVANISTATALATQDVENSVKEALAEFTGADANAITGDTLIVDLGLDSLASVELAEELTTRYKREVSSMELLDCSFRGLLDILGCGDGGSLSTSEADFTPMSSSSATSVTSVEASTNSIDDDEKSEKLRRIIADACGAKPTTLNDETVTLGDLGVDSLATIELRSDLEAAFGVELGDDVVAFDSTLGAVSRALGLGRQKPSETTSGTMSEPILKSNIDATSTSAFASQDSSFNAASTSSMGNPFEALLLAEEDLPEKARRCGLSPKWSEVSRSLDQITVAFIVEAFQKLGVDLLEMRLGEPLPAISYVIKHSRLMERCCHMLQKHSIIECNGNMNLRGPSGFTRTSANELLVTFVAEFPSYKTDADIISITGPKLGECLAGRENPIALLFRLKESQKALKNYYINSPMLATSTELLVDLVLRTVAQRKGSTTRILEVGAGFGGTTTRLAQEFEDRGYSVEYTYTDVAPTLVSQASKTMKKYDWMKFETLDIEKSPPQSHRGKYDLVIATNCIHATFDPVVSLEHVRQILNPHGFVVLSEATQIADWFDIVFGLLDGWWLRKDGGYPLQPAAYWTRCLAKAGFATQAFSQPPLRRLNDQSLILGTVTTRQVPARTRSTERAVVETVTYKEVEGVQIPADIYIPREAPECSTMKLAMVLHGGGHMSLSRKAIRPAQMDFLIDNGVLPVSFDYRLCPQVNLIDGPIADVRDAYRWMQEELPAIILKKEGITVDPTRITVIGFSTGGHLAMTTSWTSKALGLKPPRSILSFYGPTDFESGALDVPRLQGAQDGNVIEILKSLSGAPIATSHGEDETGTMVSSDPRSALVRSLFQQGHGLSLLLNDLPRSGSEEDYIEFLQSPPHRNRIAAISPLAQLRSGAYDTPTYMVHGTRDERVPFGAAAEFVRTARERGVECGFLAVPGVRHLHDLSLVPGTAEFEAQVAPAYQYVLESLRR